MSVRPSNLAVMTVTETYTQSRIKSTNPHHEPWDLTEEQREVYRKLAQESHQRRLAALAGLGGEPLHPINAPSFDPQGLMPQVPNTGITAISLFSGGGGLDLGFDRAGFVHRGSWEVLDFAAETLRISRPEWSVFGGEDGDVTQIDWRPYKGNVAVIHGGPPCQPFSNAGRQRGETDPRNMWPEFVRAVKQIRPEAFVAENVAALGSAKFSTYVNEKIIAPLQKSGYRIHRVTMQAYEYGVPQARKRVFFFGFRTKSLESRWTAPAPTHRRPGTVANGLPETPGVREALGLPDIGFDDVSPTIRSALTGPRNTTSILSSTSAAKKFEALQVWPNGVAASREAAQAFAAKNDHFRLSVDDVALLQGFPESWGFYGAVYQRLGQVGNSVVPPVAYHVAQSVADALSSR